MTRPWSTLSRAVGIREPGPGPGDTIWVRGGTYAERVRIERGGEPGKPVAIRAYPKENAVLDGGGSRGGIVLPDESAADYVVVEGLSLTNLGKKAAAVLASRRTGIVLRGLHVAGTGNTIRLTRCRAGRVVKCDIPKLDIDTACSDIVIAQNHVHHNARHHAISVYAPADGVRGEGEVVAMERVAPGIARFRGQDLKLHQVRGGTLRGQDAAGSVKNPSLALFFERRMSKYKYDQGISTTEKGIAGGTVRLADGRDWFALRGNPEWGGKPYSPDGTEGWFEIGNAKLEELAKARYAWVAYVFDSSEANRDIQILDNEVDHSAMQGIWVQRGEHVLLKGNRLHHNDVSGIQIETLCRHVWIEGNVSFANNVRSIHETGIWLDETIDAIVQDNLVCENQKGMGITQCEWVLMRRNVIFNNRAQHVPPDKSEAACGNSGGFWYSGGRGYGLGAPPGAEHNAFVHNTLVGNGTDSSRWGGLQHGLSGYPKIGRNHLINNIVQNHHGALVMDVWDVPGMVDGNIYWGGGALRARWRDPASKECRTFVLSKADGLAAYQNACGLDAHSKVVRVAFVNVTAGDFRPARDSVAVDTGQPLTRTIAAGQGVELPMADVSCFSAGFRTSTGELLIPGDEIMVAGNRARIVAITRDKAMLRLDRIVSWKAGDPVNYVYKGRGPDVGAFEVY